MLTHGRLQPENPARVVVIGARGFIGRGLVRLLAEAAIPCLPLSSADVDLSTPGAADRLAQRLHPSAVVGMLSALRSEKRRVGKESVRPRRSRLHACPSKKTTQYSYE